MAPACLCSTTISTLNLIVGMIADVSLDLNHWVTVGTCQKLQVRQPRSPLWSWQRIAAILDASGHHGSVCLPLLQPVPLPMLFSITTTSLTRSGTDFSRCTDGRKAALQFPPDVTCPTPLNSRPDVLSSTCRVLLVDSIRVEFFCVHVLRENVCNVPLAVHLLHGQILGFKQRSAAATLGCVCGATSSLLQETHPSLC